MRCGHAPFERPILQGIVTFQLDCTWGRFTLWKAFGFKFVLAWERHILSSNSYDSFIPVLSIKVKRVFDIWGGRLTHGHVERLRRKATLTSKRVQFLVVCFRNALMNSFLFEGENVTEPLLRVYVVVTGSFWVFPSSAPDHSHTTRPNKSFPNCQNGDSLPLWFTDLRFARPIPFHKSAQTYGL